MSTSSTIVARAPRSRTGLVLQVDDPIAPGSGELRWVVAEVIDDVTVRLRSTTGRYRRAKSATLVVARPRPDMPNGRYSAAPSDELLILSLIKAWSLRDAAYTDLLRATLEDLPFYGVGSFERDEIKARVPRELWARVAQSRARSLYLSRTSERNGYTHEDALTAAEGHNTVPHATPLRPDLEAMTDAQLREAVLVWGIRNNSAARYLTREVQAARAAISPKPSLWGSLDDGPRELT
jgi:hypothetical protein